MVVGASLRSKFLYKAVLLTLKYIPVLLALVYFINILLGCFDIDLPLLSYIGGVSILTLLFLYLASLAFRFCLWHRLCIMYVTINWLLNVIDLYMEIPLSDAAMICIYLLLAGIFLFWVLISKFKG